MKVRVDSNMTITGVFHPPLEVEIDKPEVTLRDILSNLAVRCGSVELISDGEIGGDVQKVLVNNVEHHWLGGSLHDGDEVTVVVEMSPLGGG